MPNRLSKAGGEQSYSTAFRGTQTSRQDVSLLLDVIYEGGVGIVPLDVAYAILAATSTGMRRIFYAKRRSYEKSSGAFGNAEMSAELHAIPDHRRQMIEEMLRCVNVPFSIVVPFRANHPFLSNTERFVLESSAKVETLDTLLNADCFHDQIARQALKNGRPVFGLSAKVSLGGSKYKLRDMDDTVREAVDIVFDYGESKYANSTGLSSTIIDIRDFSVVRVGVCFDKLQKEFSDRFGAELRVS